MGHRSRYHASEGSALRFRLRSLIILVAVLCLILAAGTFVVRTSNQIRNTFNECYAVWWVADMVIAHMETNNDEWPTSWDDLADEHLAIIASRGGPNTLDELKSLVQVDWSANSDELRKMQSNGEPTFAVISLKNGSTAHVSGNEPNQMILDYLNND